MDLTQQFNLYERTYGFGLSAIGAGLGARVGGGNLVLSAVGAGLGATMGGLVGDATHTKLPVSTIITTSIVTGASAAALTAIAKPAINKALNISMEAIRSNGSLKANAGLDYILKLKASNPLFNKVMSKAGALSLVIGITIPQVHKMVQAQHAQTAMRAQKAFASINNTFTPTADEPDKRHEQNRALDSKMKEGLFTMRVNSRDIG